MGKSEFVEVAVLKDPDGLGLVASITMYTRSSGFRGFSFALFKEFERSPGGPTQRTAYLNDRHLGAARKLLDLVEQCIAEEQDKLHSSRRVTP